MKRLITILVLTIGICLSGNAQSLGSLLEGLFSGSGEKEQLTESSTQKPLAQSELEGKWFYNKAVVEYAGNDLLAAMAVGLVDQHINDYCTKAGVVAGRDNLTFAKSTYRFEIDKNKGVGEYAYSPQEGVIELSAKVKGKELRLKGKSRYQNEVLTLLFEAGDALEVIKRASPKLAESENVKIASQIIESLPGIYIGVEMKK